MASQANAIRQAQAPSGIVEYIQSASHCYFAALERFTQSKETLGRGLVCKDALIPVEVSKNLEDMLLQPNGVAAALRGGRGEALDPHSAKHWLLKASKESRAHYKGNAVLPMFADFPFFVETSNAAIVPAVCASTLVAMALSKWPSEGRSHKCRTVSPATLPGKIIGKTRMHCGCGDCRCGGCLQFLVSSAQSFLNMRKEMSRTVKTHRTSPKVSCVITESTPCRSRATPTKTSTFCRESSTEMSRNQRWAQIRSSLSDCVDCCPLTTTWKLFLVFSLKWRWWKGSCFEGVGCVVRLVSILHPEPRKAPQ